MVEERCDFGSRELARMALAVEQDVLADPVPVCGFRTVRKVPATANDRDLLKQARGLQTPLGSLLGGVAKKAQDTATRNAQITIVRLTAARGKSMNSMACKPQTALVYFCIDASLSVH